MVKTHKPWGGIPVGPQSFLCTRACRCSESLSPKSLAKEPEAEGSTDMTLPHRAPELTAGLPCSQLAGALSRAPLIWELHTVRCRLTRINKMTASTQRKIQADSCHTSLSSMWKTDYVFVYCAVSRYSWIAFIWTSNSYVCLVGSCPLQRKIRPGGSDRTETVTKVLKGPLKALRRSVWCSVSFLDRASSNKVMHQEHGSHQVKTCCFRSEIQHVLYSSRQDLQFVLELLLLKTSVAVSY